MLFFVQPSVSVGGHVEVMHSLWISAEIPYQAGVAIWI